MLRCSGEAEGSHPEGIQYKAKARCLQLGGPVAKASTTEEPDAVVPHVRVCGERAHDTHLCMLLKNK